MLKYYVHIQNALLRPVRHDRGATAVEYGLIVSLIALAIVVAITLIGTNLSSLFNNVASKL